MCTGVRTAKSGKHHALESGVVDPVTGPKGTTAPQRPNCDPCRARQPLPSAAPSAHPPEPARHRPTAGFEIASAWSKVFLKKLALARGLSSDDPSWPGRGAEPGRKDAIMVPPSTARRPAEHTSSGGIGLGGGETCAVSPSTIHDERAVVPPAGYLESGPALVISHLLTLDAAIPADRATEQDTQHAQTPSFGSGPH